MKRSRFTREHWYGEEPFPWGLLAWPFLWLWSTVKDAIQPRVLWGGGPVFIGTEPPAHTVTVTYLSADQFDDLFGDEIKSYKHAYPTDEEWALALDNWQSNDPFWGHPESGR